MTPKLRGVIVPWFTPIMPYGILMICKSQGWQIVIRSGDFELSFPR